MKTKNYCYECDGEFTVTSKIKEDIKVCPFCSTEVEANEADILSEDEVDPFRDRD